MTETWIFVGVLLAISFAGLVWPLVRKRNEAFATRKSYDVAVYKDQLAEAEKELERGLLSPDQAEAVKIELQRKLLAAADAPSDSGSGSFAASNPRLITAIGVLLFVGVGSLGLYIKIGSPTLDNLAYVDRDIEREQASRDDQKAVREMASLLDQLEAKLATDPDNVRGWLMLGRSASSMGQYARAANAFEQALKRQPDNPEIMTDYAEALIFTQQGQVTEKALDAFERSRSLNPANPKARYYMALHMAQAGNLEGALQEWVDLLALSLPDAPWVQTVRSQIASAAEEANIDPASITPSQEAIRIGDDIRAAAQAQAQAEAPGPSREDMKAAEEMSEEDRNAMIRGMVQRLADRLQENPNDRQGWLRLANAYKVLGENQKAADALAQAEKATR